MYHAQVRDGSWYKQDGKTKRKSSQYFEVMGGTCGKWLGIFALILTVFNLIGNGTAQIVAGAANTYTINPVLTKRCIHPLYTARVATLGFSGSGKHQHQAAQATLLVWGVWLLAGKKAGHCCPAALGTD